MNVAVSLGHVVVTTCFVGAPCLSAGSSGAVFGELSVGFMLRIIGDFRGGSGLAAKTTATKRDEPQWTRAAVLVARPASPYSRRTRRVYCVTGEAYGLRVALQFFGATENPQGLLQRISSWLHDIASTGHHPAGPYAPCADDS